MIPAGDDRATGLLRGAPFWPRSGIIWTTRASGAGDTETVTQASPPWDAPFDPFLDG